MRIWTVVALAIDTRLRLLKKNVLTTFLFFVCSLTRHSVAPVTPSRPPLSKKKNYSENHGDDWIANGRVWSAAESCCGAPTLSRCCPTCLCRACAATTTTTTTTTTRPPLDRDCLCATRTRAVPTTAIRSDGFQRYHHVQVPFLSVFAKLV